MRHARETCRSLAAPVRNVGGYSITWIALPIRRAWSYAGCGACCRRLSTGPGFLRGAGRSHRQPECRAVPGIGSQCQLWNCNRDSANSHQSQYAAAHDVDDVTPAKMPLSQGASLVSFGRDMKPELLGSGKLISISRHTRRCLAQRSFNETCLAAAQPDPVEAWGHYRLLFHPP